MDLSGGLSRSNFLTSLAVTAGSTLLPKDLMAAPPQDPVVYTMQKDGKATTREKVSWKLLPFPMKQVRLGDGSCKIAMEADRQYLHSLPPDRLLHTLFASTRALSSSGPTARRMGSPRLRTARSLCGRPLSFCLRPDVCEQRR